MGELNFPRTHCFTTHNRFLTKQTEKKKTDTNTCVSSREIEGKGERNHLLLKHASKAFFYYYYFYFYQHGLRFLWKRFPLLSSAERRFSEFTCSNSCAALERSCSCISRVLNLAAERQTGPFTQHNEQHAIHIFRFGVGFREALKRFRSIVPPDWQWDYASSVPSSSWSQRPSDLDA